MALVKYNPWQEMNSLQRQLTNFVRSRPTV